MPNYFRQQAIDALADPQLRDNFRDAMDFLREKRQSVFTDTDELESLRSLGTFSRLIVAPGNLADLPPDAWREPELKISAVPTLEAAVAEVFGSIDRPANAR